MIIFTWGIKIGINIYITHAVSTPGAIVKKKKKADVKVADKNHRNHVNTRYGKIYHYCQIFT